MRWWPRSIRWQMLAGLLLLELLSLGLFAAVLVEQQAAEVHRRAEQRLADEVRSLALQAREALLEERPGWVGLSVKMMGEAPTVSVAMVTDPSGNMLFASSGEADNVVLSPLERAQIRLVGREAESFGARNARIVSISPGLIDTAAARTEAAASPQMEMMKQKTPLRRFGAPAEIATVAAFLCSPAASFVSGRDIPVDGGMLVALGR